MYSFCAKFQQILDICKCHCENLVNSLGNVPRRGAVPRFSDLEVIALRMTAEAFGIDSESHLFRMLSQSGDGIPKLISRRQYDDRRKSTAGLCEEIRKRIVGDIDGGECCFIVDPKPLEVCKPARSGRCTMSATRATSVQKCSLTFSRRPTSGWKRLRVPTRRAPGLFPSCSGRCASASGRTSPSSATSSSSSETTPRT